MLKNGYRQCQANHTLFVKHQQRKVTTLIVYVDNIINAGNDHCEINHLKGFLRKEFEIKDLGHSSNSLELKLLDTKMVPSYLNANMF